MNKFLWNLFGIKEDDVPDLSEPSRRRFLALLGGAAVTGIVAPKHFLAPAGGWHPVSLTEFTNTSRRTRYAAWLDSTDYALGAEIVVVDGSGKSSDYSVPLLVDGVFKPSPLFMHLTEVGTFKCRDAHPRKSSQGRRAVGL